jgi:hypothetical protein
MVREVRGLGSALRGSRGSVTAELAVVLPVLVVFLFVMVWAIGAVVAGIRCHDAARDVARAIARGEPEPVARAIGARAAPAEAEISISRDGPDVVVRVAARVDSDTGILRIVPGVDVRGRAVVRVEPEAEDGP